jgi:hypothetical protein
VSTVVEQAVSEALRLSRTQSEFLDISDVGKSVNAVRNACAGLTTSNNV